MRLPRLFKAAFSWLRALLQNFYFWGGLGGLLILSLTVYFLVDAVIMPSYTRHGVTVQVPNVENRSFEEAKQFVQNRNLTVRRQLGPYNPNVDRETVVDQSPPANSDVKPGRRVYLTVNAGEVPMVSVPKLTGVSVREAKNRVSSLGLEPGRIEPDSIPSPYPNTITRQDPEPGDSLKKGGTVNLWYSTGVGSDTVQVPSVVGQPVEKAQSLLLRQKLRSVIVDPRRSESAAESPQSDTSTTRRFVQRQGRPPDTEVRAGTEIRLFTTDDSTQVPNPDSTIQNSSVFVN
jgi:beta-lactam-binding protein with PASTA domain